MLQKIGFQPGINKQITPTGAEGQWIDCDNVRFRYGTPEKIGGWKQLGESNLTGAGRGLHHYVNSLGRKYAIIGTNRILYAYSGGVFYDIHPIKSTTTLTSAFTTTNGSTEVTITFSGTHGISESDIVLLDNFSTITGSNFGSSDFDNKKFMVTTVPTSTTITVTMPSNESGSGATTSGGIRVQHYYPVGPAVQAKGFGWSLGTWGGEEVGAFTTTLSGAINASATTGITLADASQFPDSGTNFILIGTEEISYTGINASNELTGVTRGVRNTTAASHGAGDTVTSTANYVAWGEAASGDLVLEPGMWSLDNFGDKAICLIHDSAVFEWDSAQSNATDTRATIISGAPTASRHMLVSAQRHLVFFGTETTIGTPSTQDDMLIRFSDLEVINNYVQSAETTAGEQRIADGSQIRGAIRGRDAILVWTDTALFTQRFIGSPLTFAFTQVGTHCGLVGQNACVEVDGSAYWMSENGFFRYAGKLESLPCLVEDHVYDNINLESGNQMVSAGLNNLFGEVIWFYPTTGSSVVNKMVAYNYFDSSPQRPVWTVGSLARTMWKDSAVFGTPHALEYDAATDTSFDVVGNTEGRTTYYQHETGTDQVKGGAVTAITANIASGDFDITQQRASATGQSTGVATFRGDGEFLMKIRRFIPDFISQTGNTQVTLQLRNFPNDTQASSSLGPFTVSSSTQKVDTRARARAIALKIENTSSAQSWKLGTFRLDIQPDGRR